MSGPSGNGDCPSVDELSSEEEMSFTVDAASFQVTEGPAECSDAQQSDEEWSLVTMVSPSLATKKGEFEAAAPRDHPQRDPGAT